DLACCSRCSAAPVLHSFPTRRSSDLAVAPVGNGRSQALRLVLTLAQCLEQAAQNVRRGGVDVHFAVFGRDAYRDRRVAESEMIRSEEHSLNSSHVSISYAVFCLKKKL